MYGLHGHLSFTVHSTYSSQFECKNVFASDVNGFLIHACSPEVADLLMKRRAGCRPDRRFFHDLAQHRLVPQSQPTTGAPIRLVRRDRIGGEPLVAGELIEILTWV